MTAPQLYKHGGSTFKVSIPGRPYIKKNTQRIVGFGKSKHAIYSPKFMAYERDCILAIKKECVRSGFSQTLDVPVFIIFRFTLKHRGSEPDLSNILEGVQDALVKTGIIADDKLVHALFASKQFGKDWQTDVEIYPELPHWAQVEA